MNDHFSTQRLVLDLQAATAVLTQEREQVKQLFKEIDRLNAEVDKLRGSIHRESVSRLQAEDALHLTKDRLQLAVEVAGLALWEWDLTSTEVFISARWGEMLGDIAMDGYWESRALLDRLHPDDLEHVQAQLWALKVGDANRAEASYRVSVPDGWLWIESHGMVAERNADGQVARLLGTHADISERKLAEAAMEHAREVAEQASRAKSDFLANMSHEVRTPLNGIMGLNTLLMNTPLNADQRHWLELIDSSAHTLLALLNDILDFSRIEAGKLKLEVRPFNLRSELEEIGALHKTQANAKSIEFICDLPAKLDFEVYGDSLRLRQVLTNLLSNAIKFTPANGKIKFSAQPTLVKDASQRHLKIDIQDTGIGIPLREQSTIFEAFTQADVSTARHFGGSGLGLAICSRLVSLMNGGIELSSQLGRGSHFTVNLPLSEDRMFVTGLVNSGKIESKEAVLDPIFSGLRVLVADDHPINQLLLRHLLERMGASVEYAAHGDDAISKWDQGGLDLILMDVHMPKTSGLQATQRIRELERYRCMTRTPIVAVTADAMHGDEARFLAAGFDMYVSKPIDVTQLQQAMKDAFGKALTHSIALGMRKDDGYPLLQVDKCVEYNQEVTLPDPTEENTQNFNANLTKDIELLRAAYEARSREQALAVTHQLRGYLGFISNNRAIRLCTGIELCARSDNWMLYSKVLPLLEKEVLQSASSFADLAFRQASAG